MNGLIERMDLKESGTSSDPNPSAAFSRHQHVSAPLLFHGFLDDDEGFKD